jgi:hypothetical protein
MLKLFIAAISVGLIYWLWLKKKNKYFPVAIIKLTPLSLQLKRLRYKHF